ncbi:SDR family oxidoreductase [Pseudothauera rhizosphaerae]|uniref:SDR family oxidoreductase n=2 Tax=Pseudothauera rhizosphaerae TaxID=2565932 RepID=A0A4V3WAS1_9RHOO|nr:SDR family oxidoreductase [Pseudothauera rhizosphaerae]
MGLLNGKAGLVTGGATGIGRATAVAYAREGAKVVIGDLEGMRPSVEETLALVKQAGGEGIFVPTDVTNAAEVKRLVDTTVETYGRLDFAFNNAGVFAAGFVDEVDEADFDRIIAVDLKGVWLCMKYEIQYMKAHGGGAIINTTSIAGLVGGPMGSPYVAAKHGVVGLTKSAAGEYANMNIRINGIAPATIATPLVLQAPAEMQEALLSPQPLRRMGTPEEVAELVVFLSSDKVPFMVGSIVTIDGGATSNAVSYSPALSPSAAA